MIIYCPNCKLNTQIDEKRTKCFLCGFDFNDYLQSEKQRQSANLSKVEKNVQNVKTKISEQKTSSIMIDPNLLYLLKVEKNLHKGFKEFESIISSKWGRLCQLNVNTIYHSCPFFEGIDFYFESNINGILELAKEKDRRVPSIIAKAKYNFNMSNAMKKYMDSVYEMISPYEEAFLAVADVNGDKLREAQKKYETKQHPRVGYITNDFTFAFSYELYLAISDTIKSVSSDHKAWKSVTDMQHEMQGRLNYIWMTKFDSFIAEIRKLDAHVIDVFMEYMCNELKYPTNKFLSEKNDTEIRRVLEQSVKVDDNMKGIENKRHVESMQEELKKCYSIIDECGIALWGEKARLKQEANRKIELLESILPATKRNMPLPNTKYTIVFFTTQSIDKSMQQEMKLTYDEERGIYTIFCSNGIKVCNLDRGFTMKYGAYRKIYAKFLGTESLSFKNDLPYQWTVNILLYEK